MDRNDDRETFVEHVLAFLDRREQDMDIRRGAGVTAQQIKAMTPEQLAYYRELRKDGWSINDAYVQAVSTT